MRLTEPSDRRFPSVWNQSVARRKMNDERTGVWRKRRDATGKVIGW